ncbi:hypothetical protein ColTof4_14012 [Colletotrichum tofieldiae]|nr:hypothetical protein ColTof3_14645 [Colletotrichum tofieldiae]GKT81589.1 hypothetical protein ColTof4_14012 [Colletotrichum tofieldiae]GKT97566.1 hypothetical protein Ct61P_15416 [Colletotrichum tofieldiae]
MVERWARQESGEVRKAFDEREKGFFDTIEAVRAAGWSKKPLHMIYNQWYQEDARKQPGY